MTRLIWVATQVARTSPHVSFVSGGYLTTKVYTTPSRDFDNLRGRIVTARGCISREVRSQVTACIVHGTLEEYSEDLPSLCDLVIAVIFPVIIYYYGKNFVQIS